MTIEDQVRRRIAAVLHQPVAALDPSMPLAALAADSLALVELAVTLEEDTGVPLGHEDLADVHTIGDLIARIRAGRA